MDPETFNIDDALRKRYPEDAYALFFEMRNGTGYQRRTVRTADALVVGLWPSRGLDLIGIEIKASRSDWLRELADPAKAEEGLFPYCDQWYLAVADEKIVQAGELPKTWGLLAPKGCKLVCRVEAPTLAPKPMDRLQLAAILRRAKEWHADPEEYVRKAQKAAAENYKLGCAHTEFKSEAVRKELESLRAGVRAFEAAAGIAIDTAWRPNEKGQEYRRFLKLISRDSLLEDTEYLAAKARSMLHEIEKQVEALKEMPRGKEDDDV